MVIGYNEWEIILDIANQEIGISHSVIAKIYELLPVNYAEKLKQDGLDYKFKVGQDELTLLHLVAKFNCEKVMAALIEVKVNLDVISKTNQWTPLHFAAQYGNQEAVDILINAGAKLNVQDKKGNTPLHYTAAEGNKKILDTLKIAGADFTLKNDDDNTPEELAHSREKNGVMGYGDWENILTVANKETDKSKIIEKIEELASPSKAWKAANFDLNYKFIVGYDELTLLHLSTRFKCKEVVNALMEAKVDLNVISKIAQWTPLHFAAQYGNQEIVDDLITAGAKLNVQDKKDNTPSHYAIKEAHQGIVDALAVDSLATAVANLSKKNASDDKILEKYSSTGTQLDEIKEEQALGNIELKK